MRVNKRKATATRAPSSTLLLHQMKEAQGFTTLHAIPPDTYSTPALQSLIYATSNDRYPGAPGTSLHRAKLEAARAAAASKREMQKELERREEMKRLGILGVGKKRVAGGATTNGNGNGSSSHGSGNVNGNGSTTASNGVNSRYSTPPVPSERARRGQAQSSSMGAASAAAATATLNGNSSTNPSSSSSTSTRPPRANGRNLANAIDHASLPVPVNAAVAMPGSPLLTASGRIRRPASSSRGASPMPLTANGSLSSRTRSPVVAPVDLVDMDSTRGLAATVTAI